MSRQRTSITVTSKNFNVGRLEISKDPYAPPRGGKLVNMKYRDSDKLYDIFRFQLPEMSIGNLWENKDAQTGELASFTVALNFHTLRASEMSSETSSTTTTGDETQLKSAQRETVEAFSKIDEKIINHAADNSFFMDKGKPLTAEKVEGKYSQIVHWPSDEKYSLSIRAKINVRDTDISGSRNFEISDENGRDITFYKIDQTTGETIYIGDSTRYQQIEGEPVLNIDILRVRGLRVLRSVIESNNIWIQTGLSCSWKIIRLQVENVNSNTSARDAWAMDESN
jgi:hypothetical protein